MSHDDEVRNESGNRPFEDVLGQYIQRRTVPKGGLAAAVASMSGYSSLAYAGDHDENDDDDDDAGRRMRSRLIDFKPVMPASPAGAIRGFPVRR